MLGKVIPAALNVRNRPDANGKKIGLLSQDAIVPIRGERDNWFEIDFNGRPGFAYADYIRPIHSITALKARVTCALLNVRTAPSLTAGVAGTLSECSIVNVLAEHPGWLEIEFNHASGFVNRKYLEIIEGGTPKQGMVTTDLLNVRAASNAQSEILGKLAADSVVNILSQEGNWYEVRFNGMRGYVHANYISIVQSQGGPAVTTVAATTDDAAPADSLPLALAPEAKYEISGSAERRKVALTWNRFGGLLKTLADRHAIDAACAVAVLCVESSGKGFEQDNGNRMVIRFENHKFWEYWGKRHPEEFNRHFRYNRGEKPWQGHQWRSVAADKWEDFHGNQVSEWRVLEFARALDDTAALRSISMGAPQIMGFNFESMGFDSVQTMFEKFGADIRWQIQGFFDLLAASETMIRALQGSDFVRFARLYNGPGQQEAYGALIKSHYDAFKRMTTS